MPEIVEIEREAGGADLRQCLYAAAFLVPGVQDVAYAHGKWRFELEQAVDEAALAARLDALIVRFAAPSAEPREVFKVEPAAGAPLPGLAERLPATQTIALGLHIFDAPFARLVRFLDHAALRRFVPAFRAREEAYPNVIPLQSLWRANHLSGFPEHLHLVSHLESDVDVLDHFAGMARAGEIAAVSASEGRLAPARLAHNPSTCYHCYARREGQDIGGSDIAVTAVTKCHRYEAINHREPGRLLEFSMREVIFLGSPDFARETRQRSLDIVEAWMREWQLYGSLVTANDPFFSSDFANKATHQHRLAMKYEYKALLPPGRPISILSSNLHGPTFSKAFSITQAGRPINTGCIGFGLERMALAILAQHGSDESRWPAALATEHAAWRAADPLGA